VGVRRHAIAWVKDDPFGVEFAKIELHSEWLTAEGVAIGTSPVPYRLDYQLETTTGFVTSRLLALRRRLAPRARPSTQPSRHVGPARRGRR
jgi:hypothetical protein